MKKYFLLAAVIFLISSCSELGGYCSVSEWKEFEAQKMYNSFGTAFYEMPVKEMEKNFEGCYRRGDEVYVYKTLWGKKYILVRYGKAITYIEGDAYEARIKKKRRSDYYK